MTTATARATAIGQQYQDELQHFRTFAAAVQGNAHRVPGLAVDRLAPLSSAFEVTFHGVKYEVAHAFIPGDVHQPWSAIRVTPIEHAAEALTHSGPFTYDRTGAANFGGTAGLNVRDDALELLCALLTGTTPTPTGAA